VKLFSGEQRHQLVSRQSYMWSARCCFRHFKRNIRLCSSHFVCSGKSTPHGQEL